MVAAADHGLAQPCFPGVRCHDLPNGEYRQVVGAGLEKSTEIRFGCDISWIEDFT